MKDRTNFMQRAKEGQKMDLIYTSTRNSDEKATASQAILKGLAGDGGLFVPDSLPKLDVDMDTLAKMSYQETARPFKIACEAVAFSSEFLVLV